MVQRVKDVPYHVEAAPLSGRTTPYLFFEIENRGKTPNSMEPSVILTGIAPKGERVSLQFIIDVGDRALPPHSPQEIWARFERATQDGNVIEWMTANTALNFLWYKTYVFSPTHGRKVRVRTRNAAGERMGFLKFHIGRFLFQIFGARFER